jgi:transposase InsO family protein
LTTGELPHRLPPRFQEKWADFTVNDDGELEYVDGRIVVPDDEVDTVLTQTYADPATKGGRDKMYWRLRSKYIGISRRRVMEFLRNQETHQIHSKPNPVRIQQPIVASRPHERWQMDLIDMSNHSRVNNGHHWILTVIDVFTKYAWAVPLKNKRGPTVANALADILEEHEAPSILQCDNGKEFRNKYVRELLEEHNIKQLFSQAYKPSTNGCVERLNQTLKRMIFQHFTHFETKKWNDVLPEFVENQNTAVHSTTRKTPTELVNAYEGGDEDTLEEAAENIRRKAHSMIKKGKELPNIKVNDVVRIAAKYVMTDQRPPRLQNETFKKPIFNWSHRLFVVSGVSAPEGLSRPQYKLTLDGEPVGKRFYRDDLLKVDPEKLVPSHDYSDGKMFNLERHLQTINAGVQHPSGFIAPRKGLEERKGGVRRTVKRPVRLIEEI